MFPNDGSSPYRNCATISKDGDVEVYEGGFKDGVPHGRGVYRVANGDVYDGGFKDGNAHGKGVYRWANGNVYDGEWKDSKQHGDGTFTFAKGNVYEGEWKDGKRRGKGVFRETNGDVYNGEWEDDTMHGKGTTTCADGEVYTGQFVDGKCHGTGTLKYASGGVYEGEFKDDLEHGKGTVKYSSGVVYEGQWLEGGEHGEGTMKWRDGQIYSGDFADGKPHGQGTFQWENGDVYEGEFKDGKMHGRGTKRYKSGNVYDGEIVEGTRQGTGTFTWLCGDVYVGQWKDNNEHGKGTFTCGNGGDPFGGLRDIIEVYTGDFVGGKFHGRGTFTAKDGNIYQGQFADDNRNGWGKYFEPSTGRVIYEGNWVDDEPEHLPSGTRTQLLPGHTSGDLAGGTSSAPSVVNAEDVAPNASGKEPPEQEERIYDERKLRSHQSQQRRKEKGVATKLCEHCGADDNHYKLRVCTGCSLALYCSPGCQKAARGSHQRICNIISELPPRDADRLTLEYDREKLVDLDAGLRYATKYMDNLKHLGIDMEGMGKNDTAKLSAKMISSLLRTKKGALDSVSWASSFNNNTPGISVHGEDLWKELHGLKHLRLEYNGKQVWKELHGLKQLRFRSIFDGVHFLHDIIDQQKNTLLVLRLHHVEIGWNKAKCRRTMAHAVNSCKHLVGLDLDQCALLDSDLKIMLNDLPDLRVLRLVRHSRHTHQFTDNTCGLIARKCPGLQELNLDDHNQLSMRGIRKIFEGCVHLRSFYTTTPKLSCDDVRSLLDIAPQLLCLDLDSKIDVSDEEISDIIEATGGRTVLGVNGNDGAFKPDSVSAKTKEKYESQIDVLRNIWKRHGDVDVANEWAGMYEG